MVNFQTHLKLGDLQRTKLIDKNSHVDISEMEKNNIIICQKNP